MFSFAIGELNAPSLHYVFYKMTWAEYQLRLFSYNRQCEREDKNFREVAFHAMWSFNADPKLLPKTKEKYWAIGEDRKRKSKITDAHKIAMLKAQEQYQKEVNERKVKR